MKKKKIIIHLQHTIYGRSYCELLSHSHGPLLPFSQFSHISAIFVIFLVLITTQFSDKKKYTFKFKVILILSPESRPMKYLKFKKVFPALFPSQWSRKIYSKTQVPYPLPLEDFTKSSGDLMHLLVSQYRERQREGWSKEKTLFRLRQQPKQVSSSDPSHGLSDVPKLTSHRYKYNSLAVTFKALVPVFSPPSSTLFPSRCRF